MSNPGKPLHYLLRGSSGSDAYSRNSSGSVLRNCIGIAEDPYDKNLIATSSKSEMAHEITILKESNNKLLKALVQKERECREFQDHLIVSSKTNADLMDELSELTLENQRLKLKGIAFLEENRALYNQICQLKKMYNKALSHSSRAWEKNWPAGHKATSKELSNVEVEPSESWEEISQKLINQMQEEMMELETFNSKYFHEPNKVSTAEYHPQPPLSNTTLEGETSHTSSQQNLLPSSIAFSDECELLCAKSLIHHLQSQVEHLRNQTMNQRAVLKSTLEQLHKFSKAFDAARGNTTLSASKRLSQPSDELFRAYFTKQLHNGSNSPNPIGGDLLAGNENPFDQPLLKPNAKDSAPRKNRPIEPMHEAEQKDATLKATETAPQEDEKICPICERKFPPKVTQSEFEDHVFDHLDSKNILEH